MFVFLFITWHYYTSPSDDGVAMQNCCFFIMTALTINDLLVIGENYFQIDPIVHVSW